MVTMSPSGAFVTWLLFSLVLIWALWDGLPEFARWLEHNFDGQDDLQFFPDELPGEPGPGVSVAPQGGTDPRDGRGRRPPTGGGLAA
jgi:hypothetical protein